MNPENIQSAADHWLRGNTVEATKATVRQWRVIAKCGTPPAVNELDAGVFCSSGQYLFRVVKCWVCFTDETAPRGAVWRHKQDPCDVWVECERYRDGLRLSDSLPGARPFKSFEKLHDHWEWSADGGATWHRAGMEVDL